MEVLLSGAVLFFSLLLLIKSADLFSDFAEEIALSFKIPPFIIGVTIVAFGTSLPELFSSSTAVFQGFPEIALGDIIGSNITNIFLVLGLATLFMKEKVIKISYDLIHVDLPFFVGSAFIVVMILLNGSVSTIESVLMLIGLSIYLLYSVSMRKERIGEDIEKLLREEHPKVKLNYISFLGGVAGLVGLFVASKYFISSIVEISNYFNVGLELIAITVVPFSSNLPELSVSIRNAIKGKSELVVGNILGSNIFNLFGVLGVAGLFGEMTASPEFFAAVLPVLALATVLYFFITQEKQITKWEGGLLLLSYFVYLEHVYGILL